MPEFIDFSDIDEKFRRAKVDTPDSVPDGIYDAVIASAEFKRIGKHNERALVWSFEITGGEMQGSVVRKTSLIRDTLMGWLKSDLAKCGLHYHTLTEINQHLSDMFGVDVQIECVTREGSKYQNVNIKKSSAEPQIPAEDDIPF